MNKIFISSEELIIRFNKLNIKNNLIYCVPNGGCRLANWAINNNLLLESQITKNISEADLILEDIIDSGRTVKEILRCKKLLDIEHVDENNFIAPVNKQDKNDKLFNNNYWIVFPWEDDTDFGYSGKNVIDKILEDKNKIKVN